MRACRILWLPLLLCGCAGAGSAPEVVSDQPSEVPASVQALPQAQFDAWLQGERAQIAQEKAVIEKRYHAAGFTCWQRFAVNDCLKAARRTRRAEMAPVTKTELDVNAAERDYETRQRLQEIAQKQKE